MPGYPGSGYPGSAYPPSSSIGGGGGGGYPPASGYGAPSYPMGYPDPMGLGYPPASGGAGGMPMPMTMTLPPSGYGAPGWVQQTDNLSGRPYWQHMGTGQISWSPPG